MAGNIVVDPRKGKASYRDMQRANARIPKTQEDILAENVMRSASAPIYDRVNDLSRGADITYDSGNPKAFGTSRYDRDYISPYETEHLDDTRAREQGTLDVWMNGLAKFTSKAATTFIGGTVGLLYGAYNLIDSAVNDEEMRWSRFWDNELSRTLDNIDKGAEATFKNYSEDWEKNAGLFSRLGTSNFWADNILANAGFAVGAYFSGGAWSKLLGAGLSFVNAAIQNSNKAKQLVGLGGSVISALGEGSVEALHQANSMADMAKAQLDEKYSNELQRIREMYPEGSEERTKLEAAAEEAWKKGYSEMSDNIARAGNTTLLLNLPLLTASNFIMFGKSWSRGFKEANKVGKMLSLVDEAKGIRGGFQAATGSIMKPIRGSVVNAISEGVEEVSQGVASVGAGINEMDDILNEFSNRLNTDSFYKAKMGSVEQEKTSKYIDGYIQAMKENFEGHMGEEFFTGALMGAFGIPGITKNKNGNYRITLNGGVVQEFQDYYDEKGKVEGIVSEINNRINQEDFKNYFEGITRHVALENRKQYAVNRGDKFDFKNSEDAQLISDLLLFEKAGKLNEFKNALEGSLKISDEQLRNVLFSFNSAENSTNGFHEGIERVNSKEEYTEEHLKLAREKLEKNTKEHLNLIDNFIKTKEDLEVAYRLSHNDPEYSDKIEGLLYNKMSGDLVESRIKELETKLRDSNSLDSSTLETVLGKAFKGFTPETVKTAIENIEKSIKEARKGGHDISVLKEHLVTLKTLQKEFKDVKDSQRVIEIFFGVENSEYDKDTKWYDIKEKLRSFVGDALESDNEKFKKLQALDAIFKYGLRNSEKMESLGDPKEIELFSDLHDLVRLHLAKDSISRAYLPIRLEGNNSRKVLESIEAQRVSIKVKDALKARNIKDSTSASEAFVELRDTFSENQQELFLNILNKIKDEEERKKFFDNVKSLEFIAEELRKKILELYDAAKKHDDVIQSKEYQEKEKELDDLLDYIEELKEEAQEILKSINIDSEHAVRLEEIENELTKLTNNENGEIYKLEKELQDLREKALGGHDADTINAVFEVYKKISEALLSYKVTLDDIRNFSNGEQSEVLDKIFEESFKGPKVNLKELAIEKYREYFSDSLSTIEREMSSRDNIQEKVKEFRENKKGTIATSTKPSEGGGNEGGNQGNGNGGGNQGPGFLQQVIFQGAQLEIAKLKNLSQTALDILKKYKNNTNPPLYEIEKDKFDDFIKELEDAGVLEEFKNALEDYKNNNTSTDHVNQLYTKIEASLKSKGEKPEGQDEEKREDHFIIPPDVTLSDSILDIIKKYFKDKQGELWLDINDSSTIDAFLEELSKNNLEEGFLEYLDSYTPVELNADILKSNLYDKLKGIIEAKKKAAKEAFEKEDPTKSPTSLSQSYKDTHMTSTAQSKYEFGSDSVKLKLTPRNDDNGIIEFLDSRGIYDLINTGTLAQMFDIAGGLSNVKIVYGKVKDQTFSLPVMMWEIPLDDAILDLFFDNYNINYTLDLSNNRDPKKFFEFAIEKGLVKEINGKLYLLVGVAGNFGGSNNTTISELQNALDLNSINKDNPNTEDVILDGVESQVEEFFTGKVESTQNELPEIIPETWGSTIPRTPYIKSFGIRINNGQPNGLILRTAEFNIPEKDMEDWDNNQAMGDVWLLHYGADGKVHRKKGVVQRLNETFIKNNFEDDGSLKDGAVPYAVAIHDAINKIITSTNHDDRVNALKDLSKKYLFMEDKVSVKDGFLIISKGNFIKINSVQDFLEEVIKGNISPRFQIGGQESVTATPDNTYLEEILSSGIITSDTTGGTIYNGSLIVTNPGVIPTGPGNSKIGSYKGYILQPGEDSGLDNGLEASVISTLAEAVQLIYEDLLAKAADNGLDKITVGELFIPYTHEGVEYGIYDGKVYKKGSNGYDRAFAKSLNIIANKNLSENTKKLLTQLNGRRESNLPNPPLHEVLNKAYIKEKAKRGNKTSYKKDTKFSLISNDKSLSKLLDNTQRMLENDFSELLDSYLEGDYLKDLVDSVSGTELKNKLVEMVLYMIIEKGGLLLSGNYQKTIQQFLDNLNTVLNDSNTSIQDKESSIRSIIDDFILKNNSNCK